MKIGTSQWLQSAYDDLLVIREIISNELLTNMVAFHAQQAVEKSFKAILEEFENAVPKIHTLETLLPKVGLHVQFSTVSLDLLEDLDKLYTDARYPGDFSLLPSGKPTTAEAKGFSELAHEIYAIVESLLQASQATT
jgi:HEPN domain-containing protein